MAKTTRSRSPRRSAAPPAGPRFGAHVSIAGGMHKALELGLQFKCDAVQVFVKNQRQWRAAELKRDDLERWFALRQSCGIAPVVAHATYLLNLATADRTLAARTRAAFAEELLRCHLLRIPYLVVHPGAATDGGGLPAALARVAESLNEVFDQHPQLETMPLLEITAGQGSALGRTLEELAEILARLRQPQRVGVCLDTCHLFAGGYDIRTPEGYAATIEAAARTVGLERIRCWHLNDSRTPLGSRVDRHAHIGQGAIGVAGFKNVVRDPRFAGLPMLLETPKETDPAGRHWDAVNLARLRRLARPR